MSDINKATVERENTSNDLHIAGAHIIDLQNSEQMKQLTGFEVGLMYVQISDSNLLNSKFTITYADEIKVNGLLSDFKPSMQQQDHIIAILCRGKSIKADDKLQVSFHPLPANSKVVLHLYEL